MNDTYDRCFFIMYHLNQIMCQNELNDNFPVKQNYNTHSLTY